MKKTRIALVQMESKLGQTGDNLDKIERFTRQAAAQNAAVICFPELCIPCYSRDLAWSTAEPVPGPSSQRILNMAKEYDLVIMAGLAEKSDAEKPYITQLVAYPDGELCKYRKTHLGNSEKPYFKPGEDLPIFQLADRATLGLSICWDLHFPEVSTVLSLKGAEIIFAPHASPAIVGDRREIWLKYMTARAYDNAVYLAACNLVGDDGAGHSFCGGALVIDPRGNVVAEAFNGREELLVTDLDHEIINTIRRKESPSMRFSFFLSARRPELYKDLIHKSLPD
ncbi:MAG TPA: nitrilase [Desulfotomaculum sp.]|nr:MAG: nitrilase [Desulfotomaculum sp. BICA1-6]HBX22569.1 nitrilase [Desulfotomaculum sp.]